MDVDIMNQEESKLKPLASELDSSLITTTTTGRDQLSPTTLRHRHHPPFDRYDRFYSQQSSMNPIPAQAPPLVGPYMSLRKESLVSPGDLSSDPSNSPLMTYGSGQQASQSSFGVQEGEPVDEDDEQEDLGNEISGMELDDNGSLKPQVGIPGPSSMGELPKGSQKNFVHKLFQMLEDPAAKAYIGWSNDGREFVVTNQEDFARNILSKHFKHSNFSSFVRQLNMYDFHKTNRAPRSQRGTAQHQLWIFSHPRFLRSRPDLLQGIKRKANEANAPIQYGEDQLQTERRPSVVGGIRSPPNGTVMSQDTLIIELQRQNEDLHQRLHLVELGYRRLEAKLESVLRAIPPLGQQQPSLDPRESIRRSMIPPHSQQQSSQGEHVAHFEYNVPSSLGTIATFQQPTGDSLSSASTDSQSPVNQFQSAEASNTYASIPPAAGSAHMQVASNNIAVHATSVPAPGGLTQTMTGGPSPYRSIQHQSTPENNQSADIQVKASPPPSPEPSPKIKVETL